MAADDKRLITETVFYYDQALDDWIQINNVVYPIVRELVLNEEFDAGTLKFYDTESQIVQPKDRLKIITVSTDLDGSDAKIKIEYYIVLEDNADQASMALGNQYFEHNLSFVEQTQLLEGYTIPNKSFSRLIDTPNIPILPIYTDYEDVTLTNNVRILDFIFESYEVGQVFRFPLGKAYTDDGGGLVTTDLYARITSPSGLATQLTSVFRDYTFEEESIDDTDFYTVEYYYDYNDIVGTRAIAQVLIYADAPAKTKTIEDVVNKLLNVVEPLKLGESPKFHLTSDVEVLKRLNVIAPEFHLFNMHLWDALLEVSRFVMAIPRLINYNEITFDFVGDIDETYTPAKYVSNTEYQLESQYISKAESELENIIVDSIEEQSTITIPFNVPTTITDSVEITNSNFVFKMDSDPIYKIRKFELYNINVKYILGGSYSNITMDMDLTPFILEKGLWDSLPNTETGKGLFLYYAQGKSDVIYGATYKVPEFFGAVIAEEYTIERLMRVYAATILGKNVRDALDKENEVEITETKYADLVFTAEYIPYMGQRVKVNRSTNLDDFRNEVTQFFNQNTRQLDSESFGLYMKGLLDRQGNRNFNRTYFYNDFDVVPNPGSRDSNNFFSTKVSTETWPHYVKTSIEHTKDFNKQSEFIGLDAAYRQYQIPINNISNRNINYEDYIIVDNGNMATPSRRRGDNDASINTNGMKLFSGVFDSTASNTLYSSLNEIGKVTTGQTKVYFNEQLTYDDTNYDIALYKPTMAYHLGNGMLFTFSNVDNYSAGAQAIDQTSTKNSLKHVQYGDPKHSEAYMFRINYLVEYLGISTGAAQAYPEAKFPNPITDSVIDLDLIVEKDSRDSVSVTYQLSSIAANSDLIIGPGLNKYNPLVTQTPAYDKALLVTVDELIGPHRKRIDITNAETLLSATYDITLSNNTDMNGQLVVDINANATTESGIAWALIHPTTYEIIIACNEPIDSTHNPTKLTLFGKRNKI